MITQERLKSLLSYDAQTGVFTWLKNGRKAGCIKSGKYVYIAVDGRQHFAHRLAWLYVYGCFPKLFLDHINKDGLDNRIDNLRECNISENGQNTKVRSDNTSGYKGVSWEKSRQKWQVQVTLNGRAKFVGYFTDLEQANIAAIKARKIMHPFNTEQLCDAPTP